MDSCLYIFNWQACDLVMIILALTSILVIIFFLHVTYQYPVDF